MKKLFGVVCPTITPMTLKGEVDELSLRRLCHYLNEAGIHGFYPNGTNGESLLLEVGERKRIAEIFAEEKEENSSLYIQCGAMRPGETADLINHTKQVGGDGVGIMTPLFFPCDQEALAIYYDELLDSAEGLPTYLYNIPGCTCNDLLPDLFGMLLQKHMLELY